MKYWIVEYSYIYPGGGRAYATMAVRAAHESDARIECMKKDFTNIPIHVFESKPKK